MPKKSRASRRKSNRQKRNPFHTAPKQGMGSTEDWTLNDIGIVQLRGSELATNRQIRFVADVNGYSWTSTLFGASAALNSLPAAADPNEQVYYGSTNTQFQQLAQLWDEYRVDSIDVELQPFGSGGSYSASGIVHLIDEGDFMGGKTATTNNSQDFYEFAATQRNVGITSPYRTVNKQLSFAKYLGQGQSKAWLQTIEAGGIREFYQTRWTNPPTTDARTPALAFIFMCGGLASSATTGLDQELVMTYRIRTKMTFRQRRPFTGDVIPRPLKQQVCEESDPISTTRDELTKSQILRALELK